MHIKSEHQNIDAFKILESPLDCEEIQPVHPKGNQFWIFIGRTDAEAEAPVLWPPDEKNWFTGKDPNAFKDWRREEKETTEDELVGWHHQLDGHEFEQVLGAGDGQETWCATIHGVTRSQTWLSNSTKLICIYIHTLFFKFFKQERKSLDKIVRNICTLAQTSIIYVQWYYICLKVPYLQSKHK